MAVTMGQAMALVYAQKTILVNTVKLRSVSVHEGMIGMAWLGVNVVGVVVCNPI